MATADTFDFPCQPPFMSRTWQWVLTPSNSTFPLLFSLPTKPERANKHGTSIKPWKLRKENNSITSSFCLKLKKSFLCMIHVVTACQSAAASLLNHQIDILSISYQKKQANKPTKSYQEMHLNLFETRPKKPAKVSVEC